MASHDRSAGDPLGRDLTALFSGDPPNGFHEGIDRWREEAQRGDSAPSSRGPILLRRTSWVGRIAAVLAIIAVVTTVATATGLIDWDAAWRSGFGTEPLAGAGLDVAVDQTQTVDGFTVTIGRAYADPFQFAFSLSVQAPESLAGVPGGNVFYNTQVFDPEDDFLSGQPAQGSSEDGVMIGQYYANPIDPGTTEITYRIVLDDLRYDVYPIPGRAPLTEISPGVPCADETPAPWQTPESTPCSIIVRGPVEFSVTVPLAAGLSAQPGEQVSADGAVADVTSLASGRLGTSLASTGIGFHADVWIDVAGRRYDLETFLGATACPVIANRPVTYLTTEPIPVDEGPWTVHIQARPEWIPTQGPNSELGDEPCYRFTPNGDWTFQIDPEVTSVGAPQE